MVYDVREFIAWVIEEFEPSVRLGDGAGCYARQVGQDEPELYGVADMACILYTLGELNPDEQERRQWAANFQAFQDPASGYLLEKSPTHDRLHNTAFALAAMDLLDLRPAHPLSFARQWADPERMWGFLESLDWRTRVYGDSHRGAGLGSIFALDRSLYDPRWFEVYFRFTDSLFDANNGLMGVGKPPGGDLDQIGGTFHYHFLYEHFRRRMPYPDARTHAVIWLRQEDGYWHPTNRLWLTLDAVYLLTRTVRHRHHIPQDVERVVRGVLDLFREQVLSPEGRQAHFGGRLGVHSLTAVVSLLAEAQQFLGADLVWTPRPLRLVLDRRPFI